MLDETTWEHRLVALERTVSNLQRQIEHQPSQDRSKNPWLAIAGKYADDPNWEEYQAAITAARIAANTATGICPEGDESQ